jgi:hypothetical protein
LEAFAIRGEEVIQVVRGCRRSSHCLQHSGPKKICQQAVQCSIAVHADCSGLMLTWSVSSTSRATSHKQQLPWP